VTDWVLKIRSYDVPGSVHFYGRVEGPHPRSCHGSLTYNAPENRGEYSCAEGHVIPGQVEWDVDADWTRERFNRYAARHFEGDGPGQFSTAAAVVEMAVRRFKSEVRQARWLNEHVPGEPGDRLYLDFIARKPEEEDTEWGQQEGTPPYGSLLAEIPAAAQEEETGSCRAPTT
jgi:hypothetical protein